MKYRIIALLSLSFLLAGQSGLAADTLYRNDVLINGGSISSANGKYTLIMQTDGSLVMYRNDGTKRYGMEKYGYFARMEANGNFVEYNANNAIIWETKTANGLTNFLRIQDDGDLVVYTPGPSSWAVWSIGPDPGPNDPKAIGDVVGRDLAFTGAGYLGHLGVWDGSQVVEVGPPTSGNNAIHYTTIVSFKNTPTSTGGIASYWGTARTPIPEGIVQSCFNPTYCDYGVPNSTTEYTTQRVAVAKRARQLYLIGANYTYLNYWAEGRPLTPSYPAQRGAYRCDSFVVDTFLDSSSRLANNIWTPEQNLWYNRYQTLRNMIMTPTAVFNQIKAWE